MSAPNDPSTLGKVGGLRESLAHRFSLLEGKADDAEIERRIRASVELVGATPWILVFAIFVASVGLNVNSTAVIIGAMLISPLMGPIMGAGLGVAVYDFDLVKRSLLNLGIATLISLLVSTLYFLVSPLHEAQSELLARTTPTIWDVLIALFGGLAGIVGMTREEKSNVIPGVAIATALMPPVCTAGFGLATGQWSFVGGALYLYTINCVFIALATIAGIRVLRLKRHGFADKAVEFRVKLSLLILTLGTSIPSAFLAINLVNDEVFKTRATQFIKREFAFDLTQVGDYVLDPENKRIEIALIGAPLSASTLLTIESRLGAAGLDGAAVKVRQSGDNKVDLEALKSNLLSDLYTNSQEAIKGKDEELKKLRVELAQKSAFNELSKDIVSEIRAQYPYAQTVVVSQGTEFVNATQSRPVHQLVLVTSKPLHNDDRTRITNWFKARIKDDVVLVAFEGSGVTKSKAKPPLKPPVASPKRG